MAFDIQVTNPQLHASVIPHRIVPVRFARAVSGFADKDAPDIDDRGFIIPQSFCNALGPVVGITQNKTVRVRVIRDRLEPTTQIFASVEDTAIAALEHPSPGTAISSSDVGERKGDCIYLTGTASGSSAQETKVKIHFGAADGPVIAEMAVRVYPELVIRVQAHAVTINGVAPTTTLANVQSMFRRINRIYASAGVRYSLANNLAAESVNGFTTPGTVTLTNVADQRNTELQTVMRLNPVANKLNAYFFAHYFDTVSGQQDQVLGIAFSRNDANANPPNPATGFPGCQAGITVRDSADIKESAHTSAHEIGHALTLMHYADGQAGTPSDIRNDIWGHRNLMHNFVNLINSSAPGDDRFPNSPARGQVGYGSYSDGRVMAGQNLGIKKISGIRQSDQVETLRTAIRNRTYAPV
ncbi:MAG: hypothetical protein KF685_08320 [Acidobacteria bacterium]|nr:hypothetical protein [Acidobacteriota bacterium]